MAMDDAAQKAELFSHIVAILENVFPGDHRVERQKLAHVGRYNPQQARPSVSKPPGTIDATIDETKVSLIAYAYPVLFSFKAFLGVSVADPRDIGCMKLSAIANRGSKRDFVDFYILTQQYGLDQLLVWFKMKFAHTNHNMVHVLKSLAYFDEAEQEPMPDMLVQLSWNEVK